MNIKGIFKKVIIPILITLIIVAAGLIWYWFQQPKPKTESITNTIDEVINSTTFSCAEDKNIQAVFFKDKVELNLSDGRNMFISQALSASGARYANQDESFVFWNKGDTAFINEGNDTTFKDCVISDSNNNSEPTQITNPASTNCATVGGSLKIEKRADGSEYGLCYFEDNRACEEWALLRGECPVGGVKTTGFDTIDQKFCAWSGGQTFAVQNSVCTFKNSKKCATIDFYNGQCLATN